METLLPLKYLRYLHLVKLFSPSGKASGNDAGVRRWRPPVFRRYYWPYVCSDSVRVGSFKSETFTVGVWLRQAGAQPADIFGDQNYCSLLLYLTTKHVFQNFRGGISRLSPRACGSAGKGLCYHHSSQSFVCILIYSFRRAFESAIAVRFLVELVLLASCKHGQHALGRFSGVCVWSSWNENKHWNNRDIMPLQKPKPLYTPSKRQRTTEGRKVQVPWGGIHEWPKAEQRYLYTDWLSKHSITWASSLCRHRTGAFKHRKPVSF